jgi:Helix-turn-helix domain
VSDQLSPYLTIEEVAQRYRVEVPTVRRWRAINVGPRGVHAHGSRGTLLYPRKEIERYDAELLAQATAERESAAVPISRGRRSRSVSATRGKRARAGRPLRATS